MRELVVRVCIRFVAASRQVDIVDFDACHFCCDHTGMPVAAQIWGLDTFDRQARSNGHAVMTAFLTVQDQMWQTHFPKSLFRKFPVLAFGFLQTDYVRLLSGDEGFHIGGAQADRIDVPADDLE